MCLRVCRGSVTHDRSPTALGADAFEAALAGVAQALPVAAPPRRAALMAAVTALLQRSPSKVRAESCGGSSSWRCSRVVRIRNHLLGSLFNPYLLSTFLYVLDAYPHM